MRSFEEVICHWELTRAEESAVLQAIRGYLDGVPTDEPTAALLHSVLGATAGKVELWRTLASHSQHIGATPAPITQMHIETLACAAVPEIDLNNPPPPPPPIDQSQLPEDARKRIEAEARKMSQWSAVPLAKHEGADT